MMEQTRKAEKPMVLAPYPPPSDSAEADDVPLKTYKTSHPRRGRFKKTAVCKSAPPDRMSAEGRKKPQEKDYAYSETDLSVNSHSTSEISEGCQIGKWMQLEIGEAQGIDYSALDTVHSLTEPLKNQQLSDPVSSYITSARLCLGLKVRPERNPSERESVLATARPIAGIKDLKRLSRDLSNLQSAQLRLKHGLDRGDFVYCLRKDMGSLRERYNPYSLEIVSSEQARTQRKYFTVSAFSVAEVEQGGGGMDLTAVERWLWERDVFYRILAIPFFARFKVWRAFIAWKKWIANKKLSEHRSLLRSSLFSADVLLQKAILQVRCLCEEASSSVSCNLLKPSNPRTLSLIEIDKGSTYTLSDFMEFQERRCVDVKEKLATLREEVVSVVVSACQIVADSEGIFGLVEKVKTDEVPRHAQVLEWRVVLERLRRFVTLCNSLVLELLQRLVMTAVCTLENCIGRAVEDSASLAKQQNLKFQMMHEQVLSQPYTQSVFDRYIYDGDEEEEELLVQTTSFSAFMSSIGTLADERSSTAMMGENGDQLCNSQAPQDVVAMLLQKPPDPVLPLWKVELVLKEKTLMQGGEPESPLEVDDTERSNGPLFWVSCSPSADDFLSAFAHLLKQYDAVISSFITLLKDERIVPYTSRSTYDLLMVLEEESSKKSGTGKLQSWPDIRSLLHQFAPYQGCIENIQKAIQSTMSEIQTHSTYYQCFSRMVEACCSVDIDASMCRKEWSAAVFQKTFALYHDQVHAMDGMVLSFQVGMARVEVSGFKDSCLVHPQAILRQLECQLPRLANSKSDDLVGKIKVATDRLLCAPTNVEDFVCYVNSVEEASAMIPSLERQLKIITHLYNVAQEFAVTVAEEQMALYKAAFPQLRYLKNLLIEAEASKSENVYTFSTDLRVQVLSLLKEAMEVKTNIESPEVLEEGTIQQSLEQLQEYEVQLERITRQAKRYAEYYQCLGTIRTSKRHYYSLDPSSHSWTPEEVYDEVLGIQQSLAMKKSLFHTKLEWNCMVEGWNHLPLAAMKFAELQKQMNNFLHTVDYLKRGLSSHNKLVTEMEEEVVIFHSCLATLSCLLNPALKIRHWEAIEHITGGHIGSRDTLTISKLKEMKMFDYHSVISRVSKQANNEATLESMLKKVSSEWVSREFTLVPYTGVSGRLTHLLGGVDDLLASLEDNLTTLNTIKCSKYVSPIKHAVLDWENRLSLVMDVVEQWMLCQRNWLYLESIFSATDIQRQLSSEAKLFLQADKSWREVMRLVADEPKALRAATTPGVLEAFQGCGSLLEQVFKSLEDYLEAKRLAFPRLYFISNNELLDMLAHVKNPFAVQPHLSKLFGNIKRLVLPGDVSVSPPITAMVSAEGENIELPKNMYARGSPELWLSSLEKAMFETMKNLLRTGVIAYNNSLSRRQWVLDHPGQVVLTVAQIDWTQAVQSCLQDDSVQEQLRSLYKTWLRHIEELACLTADRDMPSAKQNVTTALLTLDVHCRDVIQSLLNNRVLSWNDFVWVRHLRYYWQNKSSLCSLHQCCSSFQYGNEYLGCLPRLVVTPLSERCYLTLTTALHLHLGGSLIGPAGTGKSESVKDLAKALGKLCLVFNCSEGLDYQMMGRFFSGLCQSGIWCCFDEFNRINVEVLSVVAQQLQIIKAAKDAHAVRFVFEDREVKLIPTCAVFITMNPGYAGRVELPDNLKSLFRPVAMMVPDTTIIVEVLLYTCGFTSAPLLAVKLIKLYEMAEVQLSHQVHYDFGLRAVKAVVLLARDYLKKERGNDAVLFVEERALLQALQDSELSKLDTSDAQVMNLLLCDLFKVNSQEAANDLLKSYIVAAMEECQLQPHQGQLLKCIQLYNTLLVRHGVVVLGPTGGGKSTMFRLLRRALNYAHEDYYGHKKKVLGNISLRASLSLAGSISELLRSGSTHCQLKRINPKSLSLDELYGSYNPLSLEWKIGVLAKTLSTFSHCTEMELQTLNEAALEDEGKDTNDAIITEAVSISSVDTSQLSVELISHKLDLSHSTLGDDTLEESSPSEKKVAPHPAGMSYPPCAPVGWKWVILDGPVDPGWVENLNSTLDDSKLLCLTNGERIQLLPGMRILFETDNLFNASPATVSRCGVIYMGTQDLGWRSYVSSWMKNLPKDFPEEGKQHLLALFDHSVAKGLRFLKDHASELSSPVPGTSAVATLCHMLLALLEHVSNECGGFGPCSSSLKLDTEKQEEESSNSPQRQTLAGIYIPARHQSQLPKVISMRKAVLEKNSLPFLHRYPECLCDLLGKIFVFCFTWAFGGCFKQAEEETGPELLNTDHSVTRGDTSTRGQFDALVHKIFTSEPQIEVQLPTSADLIYSYYVEMNTCSFASWKKLVPSAKEIVTRTSMMQRGIQSLQSLSSSSFLDLSAALGQLQRASEVGFVPTTDSIQLCFLTLLLHRDGHNILLCSKMGTGKTHFLTYLTKLLKSAEQCADILDAVLGGRQRIKPSTIHLSSSGLKSEDEESPVITLPLHISSQTGASYLQSEIQHCLVKNGKSIFTPPAGKKVVACFDDLNMAAVDSYGNQPCSELLRQLMNDGGWYDRKHLTWKEIKGVKILATAGQMGWRCKSMSERCLSGFSLLCLPEPSSAALTNIFSTHITKHFMSVKFPSEVLDCISQLVSCAIHVYQEGRAQLLPSPRNPQYIFCIRDLSKVFTGLLRVQHRGLQSKDDAVHLLCHELLRVFHDRCLPRDREKFLGILSEALRIHFKVVQSPTQLKDQLYLYENMVDPLREYSAVRSTKKLVKHLERVQSQYNIAEDKSHQLVLFPLACEHIVRALRVLQQPGGHLMMLGMGGVGRRSCVELASYIAGCKYHQLTPGYQCSTSETREDLKLVLLECGVKSQPSVLLVSETIGEQGTLFHDLHELMVCGEVAGLFEKDEMDGITSQLAEELTPDHTATRSLWDKFVQGVRRNLHIALCFSPASLLLVQLCRKYPGLLTHATVNVLDEWPAKALYGVAIKELHSHSEVSHNGVSHIVKEVQHEVAAACVKIHSSAVSASHKAQEEFHFSFSVTPSSFIHLVHMFCKILTRKHKKIDEKRSHLEAGLHHLGEADEKVSLMKSELEQLQPEIHSKSQEVETILHQLSAEQQELDTLRAAVAQEREEVSLETAHVATLAKDAERDLQSVLPALVEAEKGLSALKKTDLLEIRSYGAPPSMVMNVMSSVCVLLQQSTDWNTVKHLMADPIAFLKTLTAFDKDNIPDKVFSKLKRYTGAPNFSPSQVAHYSLACQSFCQWVLAVEHYGHVHRMVEPKRRMHRDISLRLEAIKSKLWEKEHQLTELECKLLVLQDQYSVKVSEKDALQEKCEEITTQLRRAEVLTISLGDEQVRWQGTLHTLHSQLITLGGDSLLTAACLVYSGPFTPSYRQPLLAKWRHICEENKLPVDTNFTIQESLMESEEIQEWYVQGLPRDTHSIQNATVATNCEKWPLVIDPEGQATRWLKCSLKKCGLMVVPYGSTQLFKVLEQAVRAGLPILVEDIPDQFSVLLDPFLVRPTASSQGQLLLRVGKTEIECNPSFRLFLVCRQPEPTFPSDVCIKTTVVNFSATFKGLQDQLLSLVINLEEPTLEVQYSDLLLSTAFDKRELRVLEQQLLRMLKSVSGSILDNEELIAALKEMKQVSTDVEERLSKAQQTKEKITASRHRYQPVATRGSILYFSILTLKHLGPMYQFSIEWYQEVFSECIRAIGAPRTYSKDDSGLHLFRNYLVKVIKQLTVTVCEKVSIALDSKIHLAFILKVCCSILMHGDEILGIKPTIGQREWLALVQDSQPYHLPSGFELSETGHQTSAFVSPALSSTASPLHSRRITSGNQQKHTPSRKQKKLERPAFLSQEMWTATSVLEKLAPSSFGDLRRHIVVNTNVWKAFINSPLPWDFEFDASDSETSTTNGDPHKPFQGSKKRKLSTSATFVPTTLTPFQKLLLIKTFHPTHLASAVQIFIQRELGPEYIVKPLLDMQKVSEELNCSTPVLFIQAQGTDPTASLLQLAEQLLPAPALLGSVSLGQGQGERARELIYSAAHKGKWAFLQNCHLSPSWMPELEAILKSLHTEKVHPDFRLWLSSKPTTAFPSSVLKSSVKVSLEPPRSLKSNLQQLLSSTGTPIVNIETFDGGDGAWKQLVFGLSMFHAAVNARKKYGAVGWRVPYDFSSADLQVTLQLLQSVLASDTSPPSAAVLYLAGEICYGGRVTDTQDLHCLRALLRKFCSPEVLQEGHLYFPACGPISTAVSYSECCLQVESLSVEDPIELFGLHPSLDSMLAAVESGRLHTSLCSIEFQAESQISHIRSNDKFVLEKIQEILEQLPARIELPPAYWTAQHQYLSSTTSAHQSQLQLSPYWILLSREVSQWNHKLSVVSGSLSYLLAAVKGKTAMLEDDETVYQALVTETVPKLWQLDAYFCSDVIHTSITKWFKHFLKCYEFIAKWASLNTPANLLDTKLPANFWLSALTVPKGLFAAVVQDFSRNSKIPLEDVVLKYGLASIETEVPKGAITLSKLCLEGCQWSGEHGLVEQGSCGKRYCELPDLICCPMEVSSKPTEQKHPFYYECPLYLTPARRHFISNISLPTNVQPDHWTLQGVALFTVVS